MTGNSSRWQTKFLVSVMVLLAIDDLVLWSFAATLWLNYLSGGR